LLLCRKWRRVWPTEMATTSPRTSIKARRAIRFLATPHQVWEQLLAIINYWTETSM
jgi:hypothetical protein